MQVYTCIVSIHKRVVKRVYLITPRQLIVKSEFVDAVVVPFAFRPSGFMLMRPVGLCVQSAIHPYVSKLPTDVWRLVRALLVTSTNPDSHLHPTILPLYFPPIKKEPSRL